MEEMKKAIVDYTGELVSSIDHLKTNTKKLQSDVDQFKTKTYQQWASLNAKRDDIKRRLDKPDLQHLETTIKDLQHTSLNQHLEYDNSTEYVNLGSDPNMWTLTNVSIQMCVRLLSPQRTQCGE